MRDSSNAPLVLPASPRPPTFSRNLALRGVAGPEIYKYHLSLAVPAFRHHDSSTPALSWSSLRTELLWVYDGAVPAENRHAVTDRRFAYWVWLIRKGTVRLRMAGREAKARAGEWMISPHESAAQSFSDDADILSVHFRCQWPTGENLFAESEALVIPADDHPKLEESACALQRTVQRSFPGVRFEFLQQPADYPVFLAVQQRFLGWLIAFYEMMISSGRTLSRAGEGDNRLWRAAELLHRAALDGSFPASELMTATSLGRAQLDRLFLKAFRATSREYWEKLRHESAASSLAATSMSIKEIAYGLGFKQPSHFTKWFSRRAGITPQAYRKQAIATPHLRFETAPAAGSSEGRTRRRS